MCLITVINRYIKKKHAASIWITNPAFIFASQIWITVYYYCQFIEFPLFLQLVEVFSTGSSRKEGYHMCLCVIHEQIYHKQSLLEIQGEEVRGLFIC